MPLKLVAMLKRHPDLSYEQFVEHWRDHHGPLIRNTPGIAQHIQRYEQHTRHDPGPWGGSAGIDGVAIQWFADWDAWQGFLAAPEYAELIAPDEARFLDVGSVSFIICDEPTVVIP